MNEQQHKNEDALSAEDTNRLKMINTDLKFELQSLKIATHQLPDLQKQLANKSTTVTHTHTHTHAHTVCCL